MSAFQIGKEEYPHQRLPIHSEEGGCVDIYSLEFAVRVGECFFHLCGNTCVQIYTPFGDLFFCMVSFKETLFCCVISGRQVAAGRLGLSVPQIAGAFDSSD